MRHNFTEAHKKALKVLEYKERLLVEAHRMHTAYMTEINKLDRQVSKLERENKSLIERNWFERLINRGNK